MHIESLEFFQRIAEIRSISKVANSSHISQSALSQQMQKLEDALGFERDTFITNDKLRNLNINNAFKEKTIIFSTYIQDAEEIIKRISTFAGYILNFVDSTAITQETDNLRNVESHAIPILEYIVQRLLNIMLSSFATTIGELNHVLNDGLVTVWSQQMTPHKDGLLEENIFILYNVDHKNIIDSGIVINTIKSIINKQ